MDDSPPPKDPLPQGYRQGIITAITVLLGFTLAFLRFWGFEAEGEWTYKSFTAAIGFTLATVLQIVSLVRSLRVEDDDVTEYRVTVRLFVTSAIVLVVNLIIAAGIYSGAL
jgi:hypothetical protein